MENLFLHLLNLSITASYVILAVILLRFLLFKAPKWVNCLLWAVVGLRLALPVSIESIFSLIPSKEPIPSDIMLSQKPQIDTGIGILNNAVNPVIEYSFTPAPLTSINPLQIWIPLAAWTWVVILFAMILWGLISYLRLRHRVAPSLHAEDNLYLCDRIDTPFILGIFRPRIYLPSSLAAGDCNHVIAHERAHLARKDHVWKPIGFLLLCVYWFNPLVWLAYILFCRDIEKACDEKVIREMQTEERKEYSTALLNCSIRRFTVSACPLAFGEVGVKSRIKAILSYKKPAFWLIIVALVICVALAVCFLTMPTDDSHIPNLGETEDMSAELLYLKDKYPEYFGLDAANGLDVYVCQFAQNNYNFCLFPHSDTPKDWTELMRKSTMDATTSEMRLILSTYDIDEDDVSIIPWQNPLSSYICEFWIISEDESIEEKRAAYIESVRELLFGDIYFTPPVYDSMQFDVDGDGAIEHCILGFGMTSGRFSFTFSAAETRIGGWVDEYHTTIYSDVYKLSFVKCDDGIVRVQGIDRYDKIHLFDISIVDGNVHLTENGVPIGEITNTVSRKLVYSAPPYSYVADLSTIPNIKIEGNVLYNADSGNRIGTLSKLKLEPSHLDEIMGKYGWPYSDLAATLRGNNEIAYSVSPDSPQIIDLYYVMIQKDSSVLLVYGHDIDDGKETEIRWIYQVR